MVAEQTIWPDLMSRRWHARCPHGCGWEVKGMQNLSIATRTQEAHLPDCPDRPGPEPPPPIPPPPIRPV